ncbi:type II secretion system GspH family protein [Chitiniphilus purpureus]|uniref:Type II secretion system GspH family protein n=1 Tax=Chitiniphilus purpureus TaxID=2981137 RepID=A0ABY6DR27_9NEIS|nr:type II secretion system protein [Chitiniphilus sp. CD1]UXY16805.1 type II secretion system GspH family protein [Chitiniphilus sp. CD1]
MARRSANTSPRRQQGFAYAWVLMMVLVMGIYLAELGDVWQTRIRRAREEELLIVGDEIRRAIKAYSEQNSGQGPQYPKTLDDLVQDPRVPFARRFLRRPYKDPITGEDWSYIGAPGGGFMGVFSKSNDKPLKQWGFTAQYSGFADKTSYQEWKFAHWPGGGSRTR